MNYIERPEYMQRLLDLMGTPDIKIITGVRRSGKSELMKAYIRRIREIQPEANIIFVDFFDLKYDLYITGSNADIIHYSIRKMENAN